MCPGGAVRQETAPPGPVSELNPRHPGPQQRGRACGWSRGRRLGWSRGFMRLRSLRFSAFARLRPLPSCSQNRTLVLDAGLFVSKPSPSTGLPAPEQARSASPYGRPRGPELYRGRSKYLRGRWTWVFWNVVSSAHRSGELIGHISWDASLDDPGELARSEMGALLD
jgi:hypothetical protein